MKILATKPSIPNLIQNLMQLQNGVIPGLTRNLGSGEGVEFTGFRIGSGMTEIKNPDFLQ